jgi:hypothetical protein
VPAIKEDLRDFGSNKHKMATSIDKSERSISFALTRKVLEPDLLNTEIKGGSKILYELEANIRVLAELKNDGVIAHKSPFG